MSQTTTSPSKDKSEVPDKAKDRKLEKINEFVERVRHLGSGELAVLKRNAGNTLAQSRNAFWFYRLLNDPDSHKNPEIYFMVATLMGLNKLNFTGNFGRTMAGVKMKTDSKSVERRFTVFLDSQFDINKGIREGGEVAFRLRQLVKLASSKEIGVDWPQLIYDLLYWDHPDRFVQKKWAESFYTYNDDKNEKE